MTKLTESEYKVLESFLAYAARHDLDDVAQRFEQWALLEVLGAIDKIETAVQAEIDQSGIQDAERR